MVLLSIVVGLPVAVIITLLVVGLCLYYTADFRPPKGDVELSRYHLMVDTDSLRVAENASLRLNDHGLWEAYVCGSPTDRGAAYGLVSSDILQAQEDVFVEQIHEIVSSEWWVEFLHKLVIIFNRNMAEQIPEEYRAEIYALSLSGKDEYDAYGSSYVRQLNYHAAHDIGHAMQEYMLVGCSSFALWGDDSQSGSLLIGRNFDFYVGDNFAKNKVVLFVDPDDGYRFASISWPGMMGVLSGMNEHGLTVTINAAKGSIPTSSAMPISLLARHILQYATTIDEAYALAQQFKTFVSESLLIGSANDGYAAIIEKSPTSIALYKSPTTHIVCTNHYQAEEYRDDAYNRENIATSDSPYRHARLSQLINAMSPIDSGDAVTILRDRYGIDSVDIGLTNEKSINQFIAHHSVVFQPEELRFWVSTSPWQLGEYVCYDLTDVFAHPSLVDRAYALEEYNIAADSEALGDEYVRVCKYREQYSSLVRAMEHDEQVSEEFISAFIANNPNYFGVYNILGDYELSVGNHAQATKYWERALSLEIPRTQERDAIIRKLQDYD